MTNKLRTQVEGWPDIHPKSSQLGWKHASLNDDPLFSVEEVAPVVGLQALFIRRVLNSRGFLSLSDIQKLVMLDDASETFVPRSKIMAYFENIASRSEIKAISPQAPALDQVTCGDAHKLIASLRDESIDCVVTSTPYWAVRIYGTPKDVKWSDGEICPFGHEQTPEGFIRHSVEILFMLKNKVASHGSVWWNLGDTFNTRTQIRGNAAETLRAMQGLDSRKWTEQNCRRYSAGHAYLFDGEQSLIPQRIAERASRIGYFVRSMITWKKDGSLPETTTSRVTRSLEHVLHLTKSRAPYFDKGAYRQTPASLGGRNALFEQDQVTDVWHLPTATGGKGHGAQFPLALPGRCVSLSTEKGGVVLDPFAGSGTSGIAALRLGRRFIGFDVSPEYVKLANTKLAAHRAGEGAKKKRTVND